VPRDCGWRRLNPTSFPPWLTETDLDFWVGEFRDDGPDYLRFRKDFEAEWDERFPGGPFRPALSGLDRCPLRHSSLATRRCHLGVGPMSIRITSLSRSDTGRLSFGSK
jgi:hypothetical protein